MFWWINQLLFVYILVKSEVEDCSQWNATLPSVSPRCSSTWILYVNQLDQELELKKKVDVLFLGDSITEQLRGTQTGNTNCKWCSNQTVLDFKEYAQKKGWEPFVSAISGDQSGHLLWRLFNGHLEKDLNNVKFTFLLIGTNDLHGAVYDPQVDREVLVDSIFNRIDDIVKTLKQHLSNSRIIVLQLLPRGNATVEQFFQQIPMQSENYVIPNIYTSYVLQINYKIAAKYGKDSIECGHLFLTKGSNLDSKLMPDSVHPSVIGWQLLLSCLDEFLQIDTKQEL